MQREAARIRELAACHLLREGRDQAGRRCGRQATTVPAVRAP